jgi:hypothetical protein
MVKTLSDDEFPCSNSNTGTFSASKCQARVEKRVAVAAMWLAYCSRVGSSTLAHTHNSVGMTESRRVEIDIWKVDSTNDNNAVV